MNQGAMVPIMLIDATYSEQDCDFMKPNMALNEAQRSSVEKWMSLLDDPSTMIEICTMKGIYIAIAALVLSTSCGKDDGQLEAFIADNQIKTLHVKMMDSSGEKSMNDVEFQGLEIDLLQVRIKTEGDSSSSWIDLETNAGIYDLIDLQFGVDSLIANGTFVGDSVKEIRLILGDMNQVLVDSVWHDITIPSGSQSGLKVKLNPSIYIGSVDSLMIDFDSNASVKQQGNGAYKLHPVIRIQ